MTRRDRFLIAFAVLAVAQLAVPGSRLLLRELTLRTGARYRFQTAPVDPYDAFRGRFVSVRATADRAPFDGAQVPKHGTRVYVSVAEGEDGLARLTSAGTSRPASGDYIAARMAGTISSNEVRVVLPLDRFYMNERLAPEAERAYRQSAGARDAWLAVRVRRGMAVIEELYIGEKPIAEYLKAE